MKKVLTVVLVLFFALSLGSELNAQVFKKNDKVIQAGLGFGFAGVYGDAGMPPISAGFQYALEEKISVGPIVGFTTSSEEWSWGKYSYSYVIIGARGEYHFMENSDKFDAYGGLTLGYAIVSSSWEDKAGWSDWWGGHFETSASTSYALYGFHAGGKYYLTPQIALFGEVGYGIGYFTVGAAFKL